MLSWWSPITLLNLKQYSYFLCGAICNREEAWCSEERSLYTGRSLQTTENVLSLSTKVCYIKACGLQIISKTFCVTFIKSLWYLAFILLSATLWDWIDCGIYSFLNPLFIEEWLITQKGQIVPHQTQNVPLSNTCHWLCSPDCRYGEFSTDNEV